MGIAAHLSSPVARRYAPLRCCTQWEDHMAKGSYGAWPIGDVDFKTIRDIALHVLEAEG